MLCLLCSGLKRSNTLRLLTSIPKGHTHVDIVIVLLHNWLSSLWLNRMLLLRLFLLLLMFGVGSFILVAIYRKVDVASSTALLHHPAHGLRSLTIPEAEVVIGSTRYELILQH